MTAPSASSFTLAEGVLAVCTDRGLGNLAHRRPHVPAELHASRRALAETLGVDVADLHMMQQVHGSSIGVIDAGTTRGAEIRGVDGLVTDLPGRALVAQAADCVPVMVAADHGPVGVAHAGRAGVAANVVGNLVAALAGLGAEVSQLHAAIGPAIGACCYEVPDGLARELADNAGVVVGRTTWGTTSLDLPATVAAQLRATGVSDIVDSPGCTRCTPAQRWFSHRADPTSGRQVAAVVRTDTLGSVAA